MALIVRCPNPACGWTGSIADNLAGQALRCPRCQTAYRTTGGGGPVSSLGGIATRETVPPRSAADATAAGQKAGLPSPATVSLPSPPERIGRFEVRAQLGAGGMGMVYRAWDPQLEREVALKVPRQDMLASSQQIERFLREARAAARLRHPNIVPVYDADFDGRHHFIASAFIAGRSLAEAAEQRRPDCRRAAEIVRALAEALAHAHGQGIVHRDVKPANILLDEQGKPYLTDFGLAFHQDASRRLTQLGTLLGTPAYMPPEQAAGQSSEVKPACDQYSLGAVLYELLTGRPPFKGPPQMVLLQVLQVAPPAPRQINPAVPPELEAICQKAMARRPEQRYASCQEFADALGRWLEQKTVAVPMPPPSPPVAIVHEVRRPVRQERRARPAARPDGARRRLPGWARVAVVSVPALAAVALVALVLRLGSSPDKTDRESSHVSRAPAPGPGHTGKKGQPAAVTRPAEKTQKVDDGPLPVKAPPPDNGQGPVQPMAGPDQFIDPDGDCALHRDKDVVTITVPGKPHVLGSGLGNCPRLLREVSGDFNATVLALGPFQPGTNKDSTLPAWTAMHVAGLVLCVNDNTFIRVQCGGRFNVQMGRSEAFAGVMGTVGGHLANSNDNSIEDNAPPLLKLERRGDRVCGYWKQGNGPWTSKSSLQIPGLSEKVRVGLFALNTSRLPMNARLAGFQVIPVPAGVPGAKIRPKARPPVPGWGEFIDPDGDCNFRLDQGGGLTILVPGKAHDLSPELGRMNAPAVLRRSVTGDFTVTVTSRGPFHPGPLKTLGQHPYQGAGLFVWADNGTFLRLERACQFVAGKEIHRVLFALRANGKPPQVQGTTLADQPAHLRLSRRAGNQVSAEVSLDGITWTPLGTVTVTLPERVAVGVAAVNTSALPLRARLEAFQITAPAATGKN
jgi:predicted Ser/Thr protein kinase/regulation of enolase protein 1 (concanavalin A-like superfamily)